MVGSNRSTPSDAPGGVLPSEASAKAYDPNLHPRVAWLGHLPLASIGFEYCDSGGMSSWDERCTGVDRLRGEGPPAA